MRVMASAFFHFAPIRGLIMRRFIIALSLTVAIGTQAPTLAQTQSVDAELIEKSKELVRRELKDPNSADFKDIYVASTPKGGKKVCGWVNAKNSYGGYVGFQRFISNGNDYTTIDKESPFNLVMPFSELWAALCSK